MNRLYRWRPLARRSQGQPILQHFKTVPQYNGIPGWVLLSHDDDGRARASFVDSHGRSEDLSVVMDERVCCDTVFRAIKVSPRVIILHDLWTLNGDTVWSRTDWDMRQTWIRDLLALFHSPDLVALVSLDTVPVGTLIRGYESYDATPGTLGIFTEHLPGKE